MYCQQQPYFTVAVLPDTQFYSSFYEETFQEQTFWENSSFDQVGWYLSGILYST